MEFYRERLAMTTFWIRPDGSIIKATSYPNAAPDNTAVAVHVPPNPAPESGKQKWLGKKWSPLPPPAPNPAAELEMAIASASTLAGLKKALLGTGGRKGKIAARGI